MIDREEVRLALVRAGLLWVSEAEKKLNAGDLSCESMKILADGLASIGYAPYMVAHTLCAEERAAAPVSPLEASDAGAPKDTGGGASVAPAGASARDGASPSLPSKSDEIDEFEAHFAALSNGGF